MSDIMMENTNMVARQGMNTRATTARNPSKTARLKSSIAKKSDENRSNTLISKGIEKTKRMAEISPQEAPSKKRSAFGDITNAELNNNVVGLKKVNVATSKGLKNSKTSSKFDSEKEGKPGKKVKQKVDNLTVSEDDNNIDKISEVSVNGSLDSDLSDKDILIISMNELTSGQECSSNIEEDPKMIMLSDCSEGINSKQQLCETKDELPNGIRNVDQDDDPFSVSEYAESIFRNMKSVESQFLVEKYLDRRKSITSGMRAILIDWLVEVQENFELYHETLYLAVRILDLYLQKKDCKRENLQLIGATAMFIACKIEEHHAPALDDFVYICDDAYTQKQFINMEIDMISTLDYQLGIPVSYRFLRRYSRVAGAPTETLTLARYILESSLLYYEFVSYRPSHIAAASLSLAFKMVKGCRWDNTLIHHSGYKEEELQELTVRLNNLIKNPPRKNLTTVLMKYSHPVFLEVAKIPTINMD